MRRTQDVSHGQSSNGTARDPNGIYDAHAYKWGLPTPAYPDIMDDVYEMMLIDGEECQNLGIYMHMTSSMMGSVLSSIAMDDEGFWGGAVLDFALRHANDPQMWERLGHRIRLQQRLGEHVPPRHQRPRRVRQRLDGADVGSHSGRRTTMSLLISRLYLLLHVAIILLVAYIVLWVIRDWLGFGIDPMVLKFGAGYRRAVGV